MKILFLIFSIIISNPVSAQDISLKMPAIAKGSTVTIRNSDNKIFTHLHLGKIGKEYAVRLYVGRNAVGRPLGTNYSNSKGELTRFVSADGAETKWLPHRCMRTLGKCKYTRILPDGTKNKRFRITTATDDGFLYSIYEANGNLVLNGVASLDKMGWSKKGSYTLANGKKIRLKMLKSVYK